MSEINSSSRNVPPRASSYFETVSIRDGSDGFDSKNSVKPRPAVFCSPIIALRPRKTRRNTVTLSLSCTHLRKYGGLFCVCSLTCLHCFPWTWSKCLASTIRLPQTRFHTNQKLNLQVPIELVSRLDTCDIEYCREHASLTLYKEHSLPQTWKCVCIPSPT